MLPCQLYLSVGMKSLNLHARSLRALMCCFVDSGGIRTVMITGDYHHTAIAVARDVGMVKPLDQIIIIDTNTRLQLGAGAVHSILANNRLQYQVCNALADKAAC